MPELPEVETVVRSLRPKITDQKIINVNVLWHKTIDEKLPSISQRIAFVGRRGKYIILQLEDSFCVVHLRMTGKFFAIKKQGIVLDDYKKHLRAVFELNDYYLFFQDQRKFGRIYLCKNLDWLDSKLGIEPMSDELTPSYLKKIFIKSRRLVKAALLDQSIIAGLGNIYVDEVLWYAKVHSERRVNTLTQNELRLICDGIKKIIPLAIDAGGTTFLSYTFADGKKGQFADNLNVFGKNGLGCRRCNNIIIKTKVSQRGTYICTTCQI